MRVCEEHGCDVVVVYSSALCPVCRLTNEADRRRVELKDQIRKLEAELSNTEKEEN